MESVPRAPPTYPSMPFNLNVRARHVHPCEPPPLAAPCSTFTPSFEGASAAQDGALGSSLAMEAQPRKFEGLSGRTPPTGTMPRKLNVKLFQAPLRHGRVVGVRCRTENWKRGLVTRPGV